MAINSAVQETLDRVDRVINDEASPEILEKWLELRGTVLYDEAPSDDQKQKAIIKFVSSHSNILSIYVKQSMDDILHDIGGFCEYHAEIRRYREFTTEERAAASELISALEQFCEFLSSPGGRAPGGSSSRTSLSGPKALP